MDASERAVQPFYQRPHGDPGGERIAIFLPPLLPKLPAPRDEDLSCGILNAVNTGRYRAAMHASLDIALQGADGELEPCNGSGVGGQAEPPPLNAIRRACNERSCSIGWNDSDRIDRVLIRYSRWAAGISTVHQPPP